MSDCSLFKKLGLLALCVMLVPSVYSQDIDKIMLKELMRETLDFSDMEGFVGTRDSLETKEKKKFKVSPLTYLPRLTNSSYQNSLMMQHVAQNDGMPMETSRAPIAPSLTMEYTNVPVMNPNATETTGEIIGNVFLTPLIAITNLNIPALLDYLIRAQVIPYDDPVITPKSRKEKNLRDIMNIYDMND